MSQKVSIIMPVYNAGPFLEECLDSILSQTLSSWELIAIDDFSTDNSFEILTKYSQNERIQVFSNDQKGITPALQLGFNKASGDFITRMDADDIMTSDKLESLFNAVIRESNTVAVGKVSYFATGKAVGDGYQKYASWLNNMIDNNNHYHQIFKECVIPSPCWMISRQNFVTIGAFDGTAYPEDYDLVFRMYEHNLKVLPINKVIHLWRDHGQRASRNDLNYSDQMFLPMKVKYFLKLEHKEGNVVAVWGAGRGAKQLVRILQSENIEIKWFTNNYKKVGKDIYGVRLEGMESLDNLSGAEVIVTIKERGFTQTQASRLKNLNSANSMYYFH